MWLDELQRYLDGEDGLTGGVVRALLNGPHPVVIIGTLWPDRYHAYTAVPAPGGPDPRAREREVLDLAEVVRIDPEFSPAEQDRARAAAAGDRRLAVALGAAGYGLTQTLAAAPQLVARWADAQTADPYAWAVLTAALDVARLGARAPLTADLLRAAAPGYCTSAQQAEAPANWFEQALAYATAKLHGAAAALAPAGAGMGQVTGYTVADYLLQHASRERRPARVPASTWDALLSHLRDPADAARLADSAHGRLLYRYAIPLYRRAADAGDGYAALQLAELLAERGDLDELRARADAGDRYAAWQLAELLAKRGDLDRAARPGRRRRPVRRRAAGRAAGRARRPGRPRLRARADAGDGPPPCGWPSCWPSAATWIRPSSSCAPGPTPATRTPPGGWPGCWPTAATWTSCAPGPTPATGRRLAAGRAAGRARRPGRAARPGRRRRRVRRHAAGRAAGRARRPGRSCAPGPTPATSTPPCGWPSCWPSAATWTELRARADAGDGYAAWRLAELLAERGDLDGELRARADAGDRDAAGRLAELLAERGDLDGLRARADAGDWDAAWRLAELLAERGDLDELRARADAGDGTPPWRLADCWPSAATWTSCAPGPTPATGTPPSGWPMLLAERGDLDGAARPGRRRRRGRRAAGRAADEAGPGRRSGAVAPVRFEPGRVDCLC